MKSSAMRITPDEYIVSVLSPAERLEAALKVVRQAYRRTSLRPSDLEQAVRRLRAKARRAGRQGRR